jgi:ribulose 1,5-bisphosphate synthetase/thiazole synthase
MRGLQATSGRSLRAFDKNISKIERRIKMNNNKTLYHENRDVIVVGGGPAGLAASIACARQGAKTLLIERTNCLGGTATAGLVIEFAKTYGNNYGIFKEICDNMKELGGLNQDNLAFDSVFAVFDPEVLKYVAQSMCEQAGVNILFHTFVESALCEDNFVKGVTVCNKSGRQAFKAKVIIDCTGDGDVAVSAGAAYEKGDIKTGKMQALTLRPRIGGVNNKTIVDWEKIRDIFEQERKEGLNSFPWHVTKWLDAGAEGLHGERTFNLDMITDADAVNAFELSKAEMEARKRVWEFIIFARKHIPGWENCYIIDTAMHIGVRETRRIMGEYILTEDDVLNGRKFSDGICPSSFSMDLHNSEEISPDWESIEEHNKKRSCPPGDYYEIPYRCLVPEKINGLLVAGRCISADRRAGASVRIMNTCMNTGQAAGLAASIAVSKGILPSNIDGKIIHKKLFGIQK